MKGKVFAQRCIERRRFLKGDSVPRVLETKDACVGNARGESVGLGGAYQDVLAGSNQKRGGFDL